MSDNMGIDADNKRREERKLVRMTFSIHVPTWMLIRGFAILPKDSMLVGCGIDDFSNGTSSMVFWSSKFSAIGESQILPSLMLVGNTDGEVWLKEHKNGEMVDCKFD